MTNYMSFLLTVTVLLLGLTCAQAQDVVPPFSPTPPLPLSPTQTYDAQVRPILKARCFKCHGDDDQQSDLNLQNYASAMKGGSSGVALQAGKPNSSLLFQAITHTGDAPKMPPNADKIPAAEIELIRQWIIAGLPENAGSKTRSTVALTLAPVTTGKPENPAMPSKQPNSVPSTTTRPHPITALAASPWAPLVAVAGHHEVRLLHAESRDLLTVLPFAEGVPYSLRFSRDGALLLVAGGKPVQSGQAVLFDVRSGKRLAEFGDETDIVLTADISADGSLIALGGPSKSAKIYRTRNGELAYKLTKHTDWITALEFSPDGRLLATADRAGGLHLWDAPTGGIALSLNEHKESITSLSWRTDSRLLASASEDGSVIVWDVKDGWPASTLSDIHKPTRRANQYGKLPSGVIGVTWTDNGQLLTIGRDKQARRWTTEGKPAGEAIPLEQLPAKITYAPAATRLWIGDARGSLHHFSTDSQ